MLIRLATLLALAGILGACAATAAEEPVKNTQFKLLPEQSAALAPGLTLRYDSAEDSRCPVGVRCIWAGTVVYNFTLSNGAGSEAIKLSAGTPSTAAGLRRGLQIALASFTVPPARKETDAAPVHPVVVDVRGL